MSTVTFPPTETAAYHLTRRVPIAFLEEEVQSVLNRLPGQSFDTAETIYILDQQGYLQGLVHLLTLLAASPDQPLQEIMSSYPPTANLKEDQEKVAGLAVHYGLSAVPIVDQQGYFWGVVPAQALIDILRREHIEDLHRLAGIQRENSHARRSMEAPPVRRAQDRLPWLLVGLAGSILATFIVSRFEQVLTEQIYVSFFVPGIVYLADAIGTQTEAIAVRGLSLSQNSLSHTLLGEIQTGCFIGFILGGISFPIVSIIFSDIRLAAAVSLAIFTAGGVATSLGIMLPWALDRAGTDPAFGSGPVATIVQDVLSLLIYFLFIQWLL
ncbi:MAG TPA: magnesium transporter [Leptolyngbyaceae cyanobacterium M33_DOE_097]|uniref:Magnesium transporter n=1 Tax=Oscillatoriales cyanobacterium SpSt-418 TaxID=2282169 RepID=A0A7C3KFQ5_9CYAN|nr:magnesium transporter [Leptolyngbyaceae cyanobacterium M33_DOE_097]